MAWFVSAEKQRQVIFPLKKVMALMPSGASAPLGGRTETISEIFRVWGKAVAEMKAMFKRGSANLTNSTPCQQTELLTLYQSGSIQQR